MEVQNLDDLRRRGTVVGHFNGAALLPKGTDVSHAFNLSNELVQASDSAVYTNDRTSLDRQRKKKKDKGVMLLAEDLMTGDLPWLQNNEFDAYPWSRRVRSGRRMRGRLRGDLDARRARLRGDLDGDRAKRVVTDADGKRIIVDADGRVATDTDGKRIVVGENGHRITDIDGRKVIVDSNNKVLLDSNRTPIIVNDSENFKITIDDAGQRVAVSEDGQNRIVMSDPDVAARKSSFLTTDARALAAGSALDIVDTDKRLILPDRQGAIERGNQAIEPAGRAYQEARQAIETSVRERLTSPVAADFPDLADDIEKALLNGEYRQAARLAERAQIGTMAIWNDTRNKFGRAEIKKWNTELKSISAYARSRASDGFRAQQRTLQDSQRALDKAASVEAKQTATRIQDIIRNGMHLDIMAGTEGLADEFGKNPYASLLQDYASDDRGRVPRRGQIIKDLEARGLHPNAISRQRLSEALTDIQDKLFTASPQADVTLQTTPGDMIDTTGSQTATADENLARDFRQADQPDTGKFDAFLTEAGDDVEAFRKSIEATIDGPAIAPGTDVDPSARRSNAATVRKGRFFRMLMPNGVDLAVMGGVAGGVAIYEGAEYALLEKATGGSNLSAAASAAWAGKGAGAETLPVVGTAMAINQGRQAEGTVRAIEDVVEFASPFAFAAIGAGAGATGGAAFFGVGAIPGAVGGFLVGLGTGVVVSLGASEITRTVARGLGYDDVDRGMISAFFAPDHAEEMEGWIRRVAKDGQGWKEGESLSDVMDRINEGAESELEKTQNFKAFLTHINEGIYAKQQEQIDAVAERISRDTGIEIDNIDEALRLPEARTRITAFYQSQAEENPQDQDIQNILNTLQDFETTEQERINAVIGIVAADIMTAREISQDIDDIVKDIRTRSSIVQQELDSINYTERLQAIKDQIEASEDMKVDNIINSSFANGTTAFEEMHTVEALAQSYNLLLDAEETLMAKQQSIVDENWDRIQQHMRWDAVDKADWFMQSDKTLGQRLEAALDDAKEDDFAAESLRKLLQDTNNLQNVTKEQATQLMNNSIFMKAFSEIIDDANDNQLIAALKGNVFADRVETINDIRAQGRELETRSADYGINIGFDIEPEQTHTPRGGRALTTEAEPEPRPQPH